MAKKQRREKDAIGEMITTYCEEYPDLLTMTLAKLIMNKHPEILITLEAIRSRIRVRRGAAGGDGITFKDLHRKRKSIKEWMEAFRLPSEDETIPDVQIPVGIRKTLLISDLHIPYHVPEAIVRALKYGKDREIDSIIIDGDLMDHYQLSRFTKDPHKRNIKYEIELTQEFFDILREIFPVAHIYYKYGNHEMRWEMFMKTRAPQLFGDDYFTLEERLQLNTWKIKQIHQSAVIKYGKLNILHGHEFGGSFFSPVNPARGLFLRSKAPTIAGHNHQTSVHHENNLNKDALACWSIGCLCGLSPEWRPLAFTKWNHGFALLEKDSKGKFTVDNQRIIL